jgi:hypothetical protein
MRVGKVTSKKERSGYYEEAEDSSQDSTLTTW